jgi:hypothetical protein
MPLWKQLKSKWMAFALWLGKVQTAILLAIVYHLAVAPISLLARLLRRDFLGLTIKEGDSHAVPIERVTSTMEHARKQF